MSRKIDLTNQKFGRWTVLYEIPERKNNNIYWHCKCECGNEKDVRGADLRNGSSKSCGCLRNELTAEKNTKNLIGQKFGRLTVLQKTDKRRQGSVIWKCLCQCGNIIDVCSVELINGDTQSCGCYQKDRIYEVCGDNLIGKHFGKLLVLEKTNDDYKINYSKEITWKCKCECGNIHYTLGTLLKNGKVQSCGCTKSKGEEKISQILKAYNIPFITQKSFPDCKDKKSLLFDFFVNNKYLIEYDGSQHFDKNNNWHDINLEKRDLIKNNYCKKNNIPLIRIPYTQYDKLSINDLLLETTSFLLK